MSRRRSRSAQAVAEILGCPPFRYRPERSSSNPGVAAVDSKPPRQIDSLSCGVGIDLGVVDGLRRRIGSRGRCLLALVQIALDLLHALEPGNGRGGLLQESSVGIDSLNGLLGSKRASGFFRRSSECPLNPPIRPERGDKKFHPNRMVSQVFRENHVSRFVFRFYTALYDIAAIRRGQPFACDVRHISPVAQEALDQENHRRTTPAG